jgi:hypothetical protein
MSENKAPSLKDVLGKDLQATGQDIPEGSYPGVLFAFGEPFMLKVAEQFRKPGKADERAVMELWFGVRVKETMASVAYLVPVPEGGATNKRSNLYKALKALKGNDPKFFDKEGNFAKGISLEKFLGATATIQVKKNAKDFPQVESLASPMDGVKYPALDDTKGLAEQLKASEDIPF